MPGEGGNSNVLRLQNLQALVRFSGGNEAGTEGLFRGTDGTLARYNFRPEHACYAVCQAQLGKDCTFFTYDGINEDQCAPTLCVVLRIDVDAQRVRVLNASRCKGRRALPYAAPAE